LGTVVGLFFGWLGEGGVKGKITGIKDMSMDGATIDMIEPVPYQVIFLFFFTTLVPWTFKRKMFAVGLSKARSMTR
jgi:hypothetical protein